MRCTDHKTRHHSINEQGNALWFILVAIALLAALTITVSRSSDTAEQSGDIERFRIQASEVMSFSKGVEQAIERMQSRGISENELSFEVTFLSASYTNANCTTGECKIFNKAGGGIAYEEPDASWLDTTQSAEEHYGQWYIPKDVCVSNVGKGGNGCDSDTSNNEELLLVMPWIKRSLCVQINNLLDITNPSGDPPQMDRDAFNTGYPVFSGPFSSEGGIILDNGTPVLEAEASGCFEGGGSSIPPAGSYHFYHTLIVR